MTTDTAIGEDDPNEAKQSGIDDEIRERREREGGLTREDIEQGNDGNTSADQNNRSGKTNRIDDDMIDLGT